jgi:hypothetical protein
MIEPRVHLRTAGDVLLPGPTVRDLVARIPPSSKLIQPSLSWNWLVGQHDHFRVTRDALRCALRAQFEWVNLIETTATILARIRRAHESGEHANITISALSDDWPAAVDRPEVLVGALRTADRIAVSVSEQGLLAIIADALADPWDRPPSPVPENRRMRRLLKLAMIASEVMDDRADREAVAHDTGGAETFSAEILLGVGRLREWDVLPALVRSMELYAEILPSIVPGALEAFERAKGVAVADWIADVCVLAQACFRELRPNGPHTASVDLATVRTDRDLSRVQRIARLLSRDQAAFRTRFSQISAAGVNRGLAFQPIRECPLLLVPNRGEHFYVVLHADFLLAAADDGVYFAMHDALPSETERARFRTGFGIAFERYAERVLRRCNDVALDACFVTVVAGTSDDEPKRCDFAWRFGDALVLIDAKRVGFSAAMLMGGEGIQKRYEDDLVRAFEQFLETADAIASRGVKSVLPDLDAPDGWEPRRTFGFVVHHRPIYLWFGSGAKLLRDAGLSERWARLFAASPRALSIGEIELLESALPSFPIKGYLDALEADHVDTYLGFDAFLQVRGWRGLVGSPYVERRGKEFLAPGSTVAT